MKFKKCKTLVSDSWEDSREIRIGSTEVENVEDFCYLGSWLSTRLPNQDWQSQQCVWKATRCMEEQTHQPKGQSETV